MNSCRQPGRHPTRNCNKLSFLVFLENIPVYSEARLNKRVDCVLLGVGGAWCVLSLSKGRSVPRRTPCAPLVGAVFEITKGTRVVAQSPNATRQRRPTPRDRPFSVYSCASSSLRQCHEHLRPSESSPFAAFSLSLSLSPLASSSWRC